MNKKIKYRINYDYHFESTEKLNCLTLKDCKYEYVLVDQGHISRLIHIYTINVDGIILGFPFIGKVINLGTELSSLVYYILEKKSQWRFE